MGEHTAIKYEPSICHAFWNIPPKAACRNSSRQLGQSYTRWILIRRVGKRSLKDSWAKTSSVCIGLCATQRVFATSDSLWWRLYWKLRSKRSLVPHTENSVNSYCEANWQSWPGLRKGLNALGNHPHAIVLDELCLPKARWRPPAEANSRRTSSHSRGGSGDKQLEPIRHVPQFIISDKLFRQWKTGNGGLSNSQLDPVERS